MPNIEATDEEINALRQLLHYAVLHSGMQVAEAVVFWNRKLIEVQQATPVPPRANGGVPKASPEADQKAQTDRG